MQEIERIIGYTFKNKELLIRAFTHSSYANEHKNEESYERLEFLGDAVVNYVVGLFLYETFPTFGEGKLSKIRAGTVDRQTIAGVVDDCGLMKYMRTGRGSINLQNGFSTKVKCDLFESIIGAAVIDNNEDLTVAKRLVDRFLSDKIKLNNTDYKSLLLEHCAKTSKNAEFILLKEGKTGDNRFAMALLIDGQKVSEGSGPSKKEAEREAAKIYLKTL
ncbi:MAG: ribonuclease III [Clostridia bacterium]|nr:ribonuclease III [Clostridia bacterium]